MAENQLANDPTGLPAGLTNYTFEGATLVGQVHRLTREKAAVAIELVAMAAEFQASLATTILDAISVAVDSFDQWRIAANETHKAITESPKSFAYALWKTAMDALTAGVGGKISGAVEELTLVGVSGTASGMGRLISDEVGKSLSQRSLQGTSMFTVTGTPITSALLVLSQGIRNRVAWSVRFQTFELRQKDAAKRLTTEAVEATLKAIGPVPASADEAAQATALLRDALATTFEAMLWARLFSFGVGLDFPKADPNNADPADPATTFSPRVDAGLVRYWWRRFGPAIEADANARADQGLFGPKLDGDRSVLIKRSSAIQNYFTKQNQQLQKALGQTP
jgi:hypothetical protein